MTRLAKVSLYFDLICVVLERLLVIVPCL